MELFEREAHLRRLTGAFADARAGHSRLLLIGGEAGVGKTSLIRAFTDSLPRDARLLQGTCDAVAPPRPFAPIADIAESNHPDLRTALNGSDRDRVLDAFLRLIRRPTAGGTVLVLDDLHWADDGTLDLLRVIGRRLDAPDLRVLILGAYRDDDVGADHPLRLALGDMPANVTQEVHVPPLSLAAVTAQVAGRDFDPKALHDATGGNPFFVGEVLAAGAGNLPRAVRDAVQARVARLSPAARAVVRAAAVLGPGVDSAVVLRVARANSRALEETRDRLILRSDGPAVSFRHELGRIAVLDGLDSPTLATLHRLALEALRRAATRNARQLAHHAVACGDGDAVLEFAPIAAERAADLGSHRQAVAHFRSALPFLDGLAQPARAALLEGYARECAYTDDIPAALEAQRQALSLWRATGDLVKEGSCLTTLAVYLWLAGEGDRARAVAESAVTALERVVSGGPELARACAIVAQRRMLSGQDDATAIGWARRALTLAEAAGDDAIAAHAQTTIALTAIYNGQPDGLARLEAVATKAREDGLAEEATRALISLVEAARDMRQYLFADRYLDDALAYMADHEFDLYHHTLRSRVAHLAAERGRWDLAVALARGLLVLPRVANPIRVRASTVIGLVRARRGEAGVWPVLDEALHAVGELELGEIIPLRAARAEVAFLEGDAPRAAAEASAGLAMARHTGPSWWWGELAFWLWRSGGKGDRPDRSDRAYWLHTKGRYREAAEAWAGNGSPYREAMALADCPTEPELRQALVILHALRARPMAERVARRLNELGARHVPRGPRASTRRNPAGLTNREVEVLALVADGLTNAQIAERLVVSAKTVDHHVSAVLRKLAVPDRTAAGREAARLGL